MAIGFGWSTREERHRIRPKWDEMRGSDKEL